MFAELTDVRCYYELHGSGDPLVLVPGLGSTTALWSPLARHLAKSFCVILLDNRGVGQSIPKRPPNALEDFAADLLELLDHLQLLRAHVAGLSLGGMIAHQFALDHPTRVDRLVLVSCTHRFSPYLREMAGLLAQALRHFPRDAFYRMVELLGSAPEYLDGHGEEIERKLAAVRESPVVPSAVARQLRCLAAHDRDHDRPSRIAAPTLVIAGEQDSLIPACYARRMAAQIPGSEFLLLPGCGHNPFEEKPDVVLPRITEFLLRPRSDDRRAHRRVPSCNGDSGLAGG
jgi:pimeloyl-ACP methyl ester carboxylesterase